MKEEGFLQAIGADPAEPTAWLALADWLEEHSDPRGELLRLTLILQQPGGAAAADAGGAPVLLSAQGLRPCWPTQTNSIGMRLALIPAGSFLMGSPEEEENRSYEGPQHEAAISQPFFLGICPVTQEQYEQVMGADPSWFPTGGNGKDKVNKQDTRDFPVEQVSWEEAVAFCRKLSEMPEEKRRGRVVPLADRGGMGILLVEEGLLLHLLFSSAIPVFHASQLRRKLSLWRRRQGSLPRTHHGGRLLSAQRLRPVRHARQRLGVVCDWFGLDPAAALPTHGPPCAGGPGRPGGPGRLLGGAERTVSPFGGSPLLLCGVPERMTWASAWRGFSSGVQ